MAPDQLVSQNLERWKEHLLDTSKRNRLLFFKPDSAIQLVEPGLDSLWERLVKRPKAQSFFGLETEIDLFNDQESDEDDIAAPPRRALKSDEMRATPGGPKLSRLLYGLRSKSNLSLEEQGLTTLYVAWGFLKWRDAKSGEEITSPLVLSPMTLLRESSRAFYRLKLSEEDLWLNPVLEWKLASDYKITLPELPAWEDADPFAYFDQVRQVIRRQSGWSVWEAAYLGLFSFHKMAMYQDLRDGQEKALANPFVRALGGDASQLPALPDKLPRAHNLDEIAVLDSFGVLDCDSSQGEAVEAAKAGVSFVLQGPPGTGKSQTISNIIAGCLASGKRVLFVSEKMAALDVVHERLRSAGLDLFCLKAHSQGASKKEVIADLGKTLAAARTGAQAASLQSAGRQDESEAGELERLRAGLNAYARQLHAPRSMLHLSAYEAAGELALRSAAPEIAAPLPSPFFIDGATLSRWRETLESAAQMSDVWQAGENHVWHGAKLRPFSLDLGATIRARALRAATWCEGVSQGAIHFAKQCGVAGDGFSLAQSEQLPLLFDLLRELKSAAKRPPAMWFVVEDLEPNFALAREFQSRFGEAKSRRAALDARYEAEFWDLPHAELLDRAKSRHQNTLSRAGTWEKFPEWHEEVTMRLERTAKLLDTARKTASALGAALELRAPTSLQETATFANALLVLQNDFALAPRSIETNWLESAVLSRCKIAAQQARQSAQIREESAAKLGDYDLAAMKSADLNTISGRFENDYGSFLRILKSQFRADSKQLAAWRRDGAKVAFEDAKADLQVAARWQAAETKLEIQAPTHQTLFGAAYAAHTTDWAKIETDLEACGRLTTAFAPLGGVPSNCAQKIARGDDLPSALAPLSSLCEALQPLGEELKWLAAIFSLRDLPFERDGVSLLTQHAPLGELSSWMESHAANLRDVAGAFDTFTSLQKVENPYPAQLVADANEAIALLQIEAQLASENERLKTQFTMLFEGESTDWDAILDALGWTSRAIAWWKGWANLGGASGENRQASGEFVALSSGESVFENVLVALPTLELRAEWEYFSDLFERGAAPSDNLASDKAWFEERGAHAAEIEAYLRYLQTQHALQSEGLSGFWLEIRRADVPVAAISDAFERRFWSLWLDAALNESSDLRGFVGARHSASIERFRWLDESSLGGAQRRLGAILWDKKPVGSSGMARSGEMSILQKEVVKKARLKPLRRLFREIPHLLSALKPCMLMSPLAVAQFLEAERAAFDLVIFDEASQICPEDSIGAIMRAAQVVIVGDRKQLPPSRYFASGGAFDSDDEEEDSDDGVFESILDMSAPYLPGFMLLWHYRSRDEALISFSNQHFYDGRLITFPGPHIGGAHGRGVRFEAVDGIYLRGKVPGARSNPIEAARVAQLVIDHLERAPKQSLGVIALNAQQARAIEEALNRLLRERPHLEPLVSPARREKFFIKALENVQGDERDAIILSIGYGRGEDGKISMNFGPLNREGGERRLNVAVTRARDALTVVSSLQPEGIDTSRTAARGPKLLRAYLEMARRGGDVAALESSLESEGMVDSIEAALQSRGWKTHRGVGRSALKIDIAVEHPEKAGEFLLGIECDGADYLAAPTARDRNRLRPAVLTGLGWQLERLWSLDWLKNPAGELDRLDALLRAALSPEPVSIPTENAALEVILDDESELETQNIEPVSPSSRVSFAPFLNLEIEDDAESPFAGVNLSQVENSVDFGATSFGFAGNFDVDEAEAPTTDSSDGLPFYQPVDLGILGWQDEFRDMFAQNLKLRDAIVRVVEGEGPVATATVARRIAAAWCFGRVGDSILGKVLLCAQNEPRIAQRDGFLWPAAMQNALLRVPKPGEEARRADEICPQEWGEAAAHCLREAFGMEREELVVQTARLMGFARTGVQVRAAVGVGVDLLLQNGRLVERDGALALAE